MTCEFKPATPITALGYGLNDQGFETRQGLGIFLLTTASRPYLGLTQPPIQWIQGALSLGVKRQGHKAIPPLPQYAFMVCSSVKVQGQLYLYLFNLFTSNQY
jgi:hypothetical protein